MIRIDLDGLLTDDYFTVTAPSGPLEIARYLAREKPDVFTWESSGPTKRYACSLTAPGGIQLAYGKRNRDGLNAPQSDTRDSDDWMLQVPGKNAHNLATVLLAHPLGPTMQAARRDIAFTARFDDPAHVYDLFADLVQDNFKREPHKHGPRSEPWRGVTLQTHKIPSKVERCIVLYDKHAQDPDTFPDDRVIRLEIRLTPKDKPDKLALLRCTRHQAVTSWRTARKVLEVLTACTLDKSFAWNATPPAAFDLDAMTRHLVGSYGPTIRAGLAQHGAAYLGKLALAALLQANDATPAAEAHPGSLSAPQAETADTV